MADAVVVVGGTGFYGRYVVDDVLTHTSADVLVVSRRRRPHPSPRVSAWAGELSDVAGLTRAITGAAVLVHCAGPFQELPGRRAPLGPVHAAVAAGVPYVDISEDDEFRREVTALAGSATVPVLTGASVVPGFQALAVAELSRGFSVMRALRCAAAPDTRRHRGDGMFRAMMAGLGSRFTAPRDGRLVELHGWSEPERVSFPPPIGLRLVYQVYAMSDLALFGDELGFGTVAFKAGSEFAWANRLLGMTAAVRARTGRPKRLTRLTGSMRALSWVAGRFGDEAGGLIVEVEGTGVDNHPSRRAWGLTADEEGGRIPALLAGIAVEEILAGRLTAAGLVALDSWIPPGDAWARLAARGVRLFDREGDGSWRERGASTQGVSGRVEPTPRPVQLGDSVS